MRVLLISSIFVPGVGGSSRLLSDVVTHLVEVGHEVEVVAFGDPAASADFDSRLSYRIHRIRPRRFGVSSFAMFIKALTLLLRKKFDVVFTGVAYPSAILAWGAFRLLGTPYAIYSHGEDVTCVESRPRAKRLLSLALRDARVTMANSRFTKRAVTGLSGVENCVCVHPAIDPEPYFDVKSNEVERLRDRFRLEGKTVVLTLARLAPRKGHDKVIESLPAVVRRIPNVHYLIVGHGEPAELLSIAERAGVKERVTIVPFVPDEELPALFSLCDLFVLTSRFDPVAREVEGFGIVFLEAAAVGRPTVAGNQGGCPDAVSDGVTGLVVDPESVEAIETAMITILSDPELAARMGAAGRARVDSSFRRSQMLSQIETQLEKAALRT